MQELDQDAPAPAVGALLLQIARSHQAVGHLSAAVDCTDAILALGDRDGMDAVLAEACELRGRLHCETGALTSAQWAFEEQRRYARAAGNLWLEALGSEHLASLALVGAAWNEAIEHLEHAAAGFRDHGDDEASVRVQLQLATLYVDLKRWNAAEQAFADALPRAQRASDQQSLARLELIRAQMAIDRGNVERGRVSAERALEIARRAGHLALAAESVAMSGIVARELGDLDRSLMLFEDAERQAVALGDEMLLGELAAERAEVLARRADHPRTLQALNHAYRALVRLLGQTGSVDRARRLRRLESLFLEVTRRWAQRVEAVDHDTSGHVDRVADLTCEIARRMGVDPAALFGYRVGAYLHDIGKLAVPAAILNKRGRLTAEEWAAVKRHPAAGAAMLTDTDFPWEVRPMVESHHECWDGSGYPHGLAGEGVPLAARIFCATDVYDALITRRAFKDALPREEAVEVMRRDVGRLFDPAVFRVFEDVVREGVPIPGITSAALLVKAPRVDTPLVDDPLTGVADFASWSARAAAALGERPGIATELGVLLIDIDDFARVNATYGRLQGDDVLWAVAKVLQRGLRSGDVIGRRGRDEFVVLLPDANAALSAEIAERLRVAVAGLRCAVRDVPDETLVVSVSVAVAVAPRDGESTETLLAATDRALFRAKREGRDHVVVADRTEPARAQNGLDFRTFVGREDEVRHLVAQLDSAARGDARFAGVVGEAGIGKSALVQQLEPEVRLRDGLLATGRAVADASEGAYAPWAAVISQLVRLGGTGDRAWRALSQLVPADIPRVDPTEPDAPDALLQQEIVSFIRRLARRRLVVIVLEDLQCAAPAVWATLDALLSSVEDERLLVVYTLRPDVSATTAEWRRRAQQNPRGTHVSLRRFRLDEVRRWITAVFHDAAPGDDVARWIHEHAEGIPLFVLHLLRAGCEDGTIWYGGTRWEWRAPDAGGVASGVMWVLERRLDRLSAASRAVLASASVLQHTLTLELLVSVTGVSEAGARTAFEEGVSASVLAPAGDTADGRFAFCHPLLVEACLRALPERHRQQVHDLAARVLELRAPSSVEAITAHYHAGGNDVAAFAYALTIAESSLGSCAHDTALAALQLAQRYAPSSRELATLRVRQAEVSVHAGRYAHGEGLSDLALEWLDRQAVDATTLRGRRVRDWLRLRRGRPAGRVAESLRLLVDEATVSAPGEVAQTAIVAARCELARAHWTGAAQYARLALEHAIDAHADSVAADALLSLGAAEFPETPELGLTRLRQARERCTTLGDPWIEARALHALGEAVARHEASAEGEDLLVSALDQSRASHHAPLAALVSRSLGELRARQGEFEEARQWLGDAERLFTTMEDEPDRLHTLLAGAMMRRQAGERDVAHAQFDAVARRARDLDFTWMELTATAGAALCNGGPDAASSVQRWERIGELVADAPADWWFAGREMVDAFAVRMALVGGHASVAHDLFQRAALRLNATDAFAGTWFVAECGPQLQRAGIRAMDRSLSEAAERARQLGFRALTGVLVR